MRVTRITAAVVALLLATLLPAPAHAEDWTRPIPLESADWLASGPAVAVARNGMTIVAWVARKDGGAWIRYRRIRSGALGPVHTLNGAEPGDVSGQLDVAVDDDGDALFTWIRFDQMAQIWQVMAQRVHRDDSVGPQVLLSGPTLSAWIPKSAMTPDGDGAVAFDESNADKSASHQVVVRISSGGSAGRRWTLPMAPGAVSPLQATRGGHFVTLGWEDGRVVGHRLLPDDRLRSRVISTRRSGQATVAALGIGRKGVAYVVYVAGRDRRPTRLWARRWERDGTLTRVRRITPADQATGAVSAAVDRDGDMVIAWPGVQIGGFDVVAHSRVWRHDGSVGPVRRLGSSQGWEGLYHQHFEPLVAVDADGDGVLVWGSEDAEGETTTWARRVRQDGGVGRRFVMAADAWPAFAAYTPQGRGRVGLFTDAGIALRMGR